MVKNQKYPANFLQHFITSRFSSPKCRWLVKIFPVLICWLNKSHEKWLSAKSVEYFEFKFEGKIKSEILTFCSWDEWDCVKVRKPFFPPGFWCIWCVFVVEKTNLFSRIKFYRGVRRWKIAYVVWIKLKKRLFNTISFSFLFCDASAQITMNVKDGWKSLFCIRSMYNMKTSGETLLHAKLYHTPTGLAMLNTEWIEPFCGDLTRQPLQLPASESLLIIPH